MNDDSLVQLFRIEKINDAIHSFEKKYIQFHLEQNEGNISKTAEDLGIERTTLYRKLNR